jgi:hypothetical protein
VETAPDTTTATRPAHLQNDLPLRRLWAGLVLALFNGLLFSYLWWGKMQYLHATYLGVVYGFCLVLVFGSHWMFSDSRRRLGLRLDNGWATIRTYGTLTLGAAALIITAGLLLGDYEFTGLSKIAPYIIWAGLQQYILQGFLRPRFEDLIEDGSETAVRTSASVRFSARRLLPAFLAASVFAMLHYPSPLLVLLTFAGGLAWCLSFQRVPSLPGVWFSHAVLGILLVLFFKQGCLDEFQIGLPGHRFESYGDGVQVAGGYGADGTPLIATLPGPDRGHTSLVRLFEVHGKKQSEWTAFPEFDFSGRLAVGDLGFGPGDEVAVVPGPAPGNPAVVRIFDRRGHQLEEFTANDLPQDYGASVSIHCGEIYLAAGPGPEAPARITAYSPDGRPRQSWDLGGKTKFVNGIDGAGFGKSCEEEAASGLLAWGTEVSVNSSRVFLLRGNEVVETFDALPTTFGLHLLTLRLRHAATGVAVAPGPLVGYPPWIRVYLRGKKWALMHEFVPPGNKGSAGANLGAVDVDGDGEDELILGEGAAPGRPPLVRIFRLNGTLLDQWKAY